ncbi:hypothetical protein [Halomicrobium sp. LC1Hm]|uniref:hypothetical protein n=1 Tax=Halomicrobium sp. LC1Hm TaxID=2610902 RepID=UPI00129843FF|nr:hypothetical protein [Halomicrobium sp. LC1Hm]QGA82075.1 hypothetical protein LC1Hm_1015 [Halomicrobium sp. LC1Hm]
MDDEEIQSHYRDIIRDLADDEIEYIRVDLDAIGFPEQREEEFGEMTRVVTIKDVEQSKILRPLIANIAESEDDIENQYGIEVLDEEEAVLYGI